MLNGLKGLRHSGPVRSSVVLGIPAALLTFVLYLAGKAEHAVLETIGSTVVIHSSSNDAAFIATGGKHEDVHHGAPREEVDGAPEVEGTPAGEEDGEEAYEAPERPTRFHFTSESGGRVFPEEWLLEATATMAVLDQNITKYRDVSAFQTTYDNLVHGVYVRIEDGKMYAKAKQLEWTKEFVGDWDDMMNTGKGPIYELFTTLGALCKAGFDRNIDFMYNVADESVGTVSDGGVPAFGWVKTGFNTDLLIPYPYTYADIPDTSSWPDEFRDSSSERGERHRFDERCRSDAKARVDAEWGRKIDKAIWRGSTTGVEPFTVDNWRDQWRPKVVKYCMEHGEVCDAAIAGIVQAEEDAAEEMRLELAVGDEYYKDMDEQSKYKYALLLDGNSAPSSRMVTNLGSTSAIVKQASPYMEFYYHSLQPYIHYLPISNAIGDDIGSIIQWARAHDEEVKQMVVRANEFRCQNLRKDVIEPYIVDVFHMYADRLENARGVFSTEEMTRLSSTVIECPSMGMEKGG
jgi:hypothetical protein